MLDFNSTLENNLSKDSTRAYWYLKLYYGNETNFTGISDKDRTIGSDVYYGLVADWGKFTHSLSVDNFTANQNTWSIKIINTEKNISASVLSIVKMNFGTYFPNDEFLKICKKFSSNTNAITGITKLIPIASINDESIKIATSK